MHWLVLAVAAAQDMRGACVSCGDAFRSCELSCLLPAARPNSELAWPYNPPELGTQLESCIGVCDADLDSCTDSDATMACLSCVESCSIAYDDEMRRCLLAVDELTTMSFGVNLDACAVNASSTMDACAENCYGEDRFFGWSPQAEEGEEVTAPFTFDEYRTSLGRDTAQAQFRAADTTRKPRWPSYLHMSGAVGIAMLLAGLALERYSPDR